MSKPSPQARRPGFGPKNRTIYLPSTERSFRKSVMDPRPVEHLIHCYPIIVDQREEFHTFSEFSGIKKELDPC